jgi:hypothetical protein
MAISSIDLHFKWGVWSRTVLITTLAFPVGRFTGVGSTVILLIVAQRLLCPFKSFLDVFLLFLILVFKGL